MQATDTVGPLARSLGLTQMGIAAFAAALAGWGFGATYAIAALYGGLCAALPMAYFAFRVSSQRASAPPAEVVGAAFRGEIGKFAMTVVLLWLGITIFTEQFMALLASYAACLMAYWVVMARAATKDNQGNQAKHGR